MNVNDDEWIWISNSDYYWTSNEQSLQIKKKYTKGKRFLFRFIIIVFCCYGPAFLMFYFRRTFNIAFSGYLAYLESTVFIVGLIVAIPVSKFIISIPQKILITENEVLLTGFFKRIKISVSSTSLFFIEKESVGGRLPHLVEKMNLRRSGKRPYTIAKIVNPINGGFQPIIEKIKNLNQNMNITN